MRSSMAMLVTENNLLRPQLCAAVIVCLVTEESKVSIYTSMVYLWRVSTFSCSASFFDVTILST